jgi:hypothetical protein
MEGAVEPRCKLASAGEFDAFIDLSRSRLDTEQLGEYLILLRTQSNLLAEDRRVTLAPPVGANVSESSGISAPDGTPAEALGAALAAAAAQARGLAVIRGAWLPGNEVVSALAELQNVDPLIGTVQPRFAAPDDDRVIGLPDARMPPAPALHRAALPFLPPTILTPELNSALLLLSPRAVSAAGEPGSGPLAAVLDVMLAGLRRRGFRNLVANRVVVPFPFDAASAYPEPDLSGHEPVRPWQQDSARARNWLAALPERAFEAVLAGAFTSDGRARLLLDCRGMADLHNGTSEAVLGFLKGFAELQPPGFEITALVSSAAARFHGISGRFSHLRVQLDQPAGSYLAAVLLNQPWSAEQVAELHDRAAIIAFNMLDTIAWDTIYPVASDGVDETWRLIARLSDGLVFISNFTRDRFVFRFMPDPGIPLVVSHLSMSADELARGPVGNAPFDEQYLLLIGNNYDHKDVRPTLATLTDAFPYTRIVVLGAKGPRSSRIVSLQSGHIEEDQVNALIAHSTAIIYPSYYEGFGLPVVEGLARGRTVIVRRSPLWEEIAAHSDLPGAIVPVSDEGGLVEAVGRALHGLPARGLPCGGALAPGARPPNWRDCAARIVDMIGRLALRCDGRNWIARQVLLRSTAAAAGQR